MISGFNYLLLGSAALICVGLYNVKYETQTAEKDLAALTDKIAQERQQLRLLQAEWALRTEPDRLQRLTEHHLEMVPVSATQIVNIADLPLPSSYHTVRAQDGAGPPETQPMLASYAPVSHPVPVKKATRTRQVLRLDAPSVVTLPVVPRRNPFTRVAQARSGGAQ